MTNCIGCGRETVNPRATRCKSCSNRENNLGRIPWNKGLTKETVERVRININPLYGRKLSKESIKKRKESRMKNGWWKNFDKTSKKMSFSRTGEKNVNWNGGSSFEPYDKCFNNKFKRAIRKRDNQVCMLCGIHREKINQAFDVHHINYDKLMSIKENCISLCRSCHFSTNVNREHWTKFFQSILSKNYGYRYSEKDIILDVGVENVQQINFGGNGKSQIGER